MVPFILHHQHILLVNYIQMSYSVLFFSILVVIFYCPLNKLLMTVVKHIFPCHGLNSHFCSKFPPSSHFCKMIICLHLFLQSGYHINWGQSCLLKAMNSGFFGGVAPNYVESWLGSSSQTGPIGVSSSMHQCLIFTNLNCQNSVSWIYTTDLWRVQTLSAF